MWFAVLKFRRATSADTKDVSMEARSNDVVVGSAASFHDSGAGAFVQTVQNSEHRAQERVNIQ